MIVRWPEDRKEVRPRHRNRQTYFGLKIHGPNSLVYMILIFPLFNANDVESKGQLISKGLLGAIVSTKKETNNF